jgi:hypothetical protein
MTKKEILSSYRVDKLGSSTVFIRNKHFDFAYTIANHVVKDEFKDKYKYFGGLQCNYNDDTEEYKNLEKWLCEIAEQTLKHVDYENNNSR